jgi:hypothetical protein
MRPSTWGCTVTELRDFREPTNSVVCSTGWSARVTIPTGVGGIEPPAPPGTPGSPPHADTRTAATDADTNDSLMV